MFEITSRKMVDLIHDCMKELVRPGDWVCDCTMGNGNDTLYLCSLVGENGRVYSFDIQQQALERTKELLEAHQTGGCATLILDSHSNALQYIHGRIRFFVFNLGYLPGSDQTVITKAGTTVQSIHDILTLTEAGGGGAVLSYYGHPGGQEEKDAVEDYLQNLPPKYFSVMKIEAFNRKNMPPVLYLIKRLKDCK